MLRWYIIREKTTEEAQQLKIWFLNATSVVVMQQQIFTNKIYVLQAELNSYPFITVPFTIYCIRKSLLYLPIRKVLLEFL